MHKITSIILALMVLVGVVGLPQVASAATEATTAGQFTVGSVSPSVTGMDVYSDAGLTLIASSLTPQVTYYKKITVSDPNTLNDITEIKLKMFYDATGGNPDQSTITAGNQQTAAIITWTKAGNIWAIDSGTGLTTWAVVTGSCVLPSMSASSGDWIVAFQIGKVATQSLGAANWDFWGQAKNTAGVVAGVYKRDKTMQWYGQVTVNTPNVDFGTVTPGTGFVDVVPNKVTGISVSFLANGNYNELVKSAATWAGSSHTAIYDVTGNAVNPNEFSLMACLHDTFASAVQVDTTGVILQNTDTQTLEAGETHSNETLWIKLAPVFAIDIYHGTITYIIANR